MFLDEDFFQLWASSTLGNTCKFLIVNMKILELGHRKESNSKKVK